MPYDAESLNSNDLETYIDTYFTRALFRLETLDLYRIDLTGQDFARYCAGEQEPDMERKQKWLNVIRREVSEERYTRRVHIVRSPLNDYLRYECEWGYAYNAEAGEDIRILDLAEVAAPETLLLEDFWLIDDDRVVLMHYDEHGEFLKGEVLPETEVELYRTVRDATWDKAVPFADYWAAHPQYWQINQKP